MDIVFFGSGSFGLPTLRALAERHTIRGVVTQPDRPAGRGGKLTPTPIGQFSADGLPDVPLVKPDNVNAPDVVARVRGLPAHAWVVIAFGQKLSPGLLAERFAINLHASLLPRWRGAAPINWAILAGDRETGNSVITLADRMDAGLVLAQSQRAIDPLVTAGELHDRLAEDGPSLVLETLSQHEAGTLSPRQQDPAGVTLARKLKKADGALDLGSTAEECRRKVHGLTPWPGATLRFRGQDLKVCRVKVHDAPPESKEVCGGGRMGIVANAESGLVCCAGSTMLQLIEVQPAGKRVMTWAEFTRGSRVRDGEVLENGVVGASGEP